MRTRAVLAAGVIALGACGGGADDGTPGSTTIGPAVRACGPPPTPTVQGTREAFLPPDAVVTGILPADDRTTIDAYVPRVPVAIRAEYEGRTDVTVLESEDEGHEAELLLSDGRRRAAVTAEISCETGSRLRVVVAPEQATTTTGQATP